MERKTAANESFLKIEIDSPLASFLTIAAIAHGLFSLLASGGMYLAVSQMLPQQTMAGIYAMAAVYGGVFLILLYLRTNFKCYYAINSTGKSIDLVRSLLVYESRVRFIDFSQIELVSASGIRRRHVFRTGEVEYAYVLCLLDKRGEMYKFSKVTQDLAQLNSTAALVASAADCRALVCKSEHVITGEKQDDRVRVKLLFMPIDEVDNDELPFEKLVKQSAEQTMILAALLTSFAVVFLSSLLLLVIFTRL